MEQLTLLKGDIEANKKLCKLKFIEENVNVYPYTCNNLSIISRITSNFKDEIIYFEIDDNDIRLIKTKEISKREIFKKDHKLTTYLNILIELKFFAVVDYYGYKLYDEIFYKTPELYEKYISYWSSEVNHRITTVTETLNDIKVIKVELLEENKKEKLKTILTDNSYKNNNLYYLYTYGMCKYNKKIVDILAEHNIPYSIKKIKGARTRFYELVRNTLKIDLSETESSKKEEKSLQVWQYDIMKKLPLDIKIKKTQQRIMEWYEHFNGNVYISFSGGKDSTVLLELARYIYPNIEAVFVNTGLEYPEIVEFVKSQNNVIMLKPEKTFKQVLTEYGYPVISKEISAAIRKVRSPYTSDEYKNYLLNGDHRGSYGKIPNEYQYLINAPFKISEICCNVMKKNPIRKYEKENKKVAITAEFAEESRLRMQEYLKHGCNAFYKKHPKSTPLGFWTENDILEFIYAYKISIAKIYGNVIKTKEGFTTTGEKRTGCIYCMFGIQYEQEPNRFQRLQESHPKLHEYCINKLGLGNVLDYMKIPYTNNIKQLMLI